MKRLLRTSVLLLLAAVLLLPTVSVAASPSAGGWSWTVVTEWFQSWWPGLGGTTATEAASTVPEGPLSEAEDPASPPTTTVETETTGPVEDGGSTEAHPKVDPNG